MKNRFIKAYSILEILVTLAIFGVLSVALMQTLFDNLTLSNRITARSQIGSELDQMISLVQKDFRNADDLYLNHCSNAGESFNGYTCASLCQLEVNAQTIRWCYVAGAGAGASANFGLIYRFDETTKTFTSSSLVNITNLNFAINVNNPEEVGTHTTPYANILVTLEAENSNLGITNQVRQLTITTRNYQIK